MLNWKGNDLEKSPYTWRKKLEKLLAELKDADTIRQMGDDDEMGSLFVKPIMWS